MHYDKILEYARAHRSDKAMYPYLEVVANDRQEYRFFHSSEIVEQSQRR